MTNTEKYLNRAIVILDDIRQNGYTYPSEVDGDIHCYFCEAQMRYEEHYDDCACIRAIEFMNELRASRFKVTVKEAKP